MKASKAAAIAERRSQLIEDKEKVLLRLGLAFLLRTRVPNFDACYLGMAADEPVSESAI